MHCISDEGRRDTRVRGIIKRRRSLNCEAGKFRLGTTVDQATAPYALPQSATKSLLIIDIQGLLPPAHCQSFKLSFGNLSAMWTTWSPCVRSTFPMCFLLQLLLLFTYALSLPQMPQICPSQILCNRFRSSNMTALERGMEKYPFHQWSG